MNFITQHIAQIIDIYAGETPLSIFLKSYFKENKNIGSRDRKAISEGVYIYYRSALFLNTTDDVIATLKQGMLLCESKNTYLAHKLGLTGNETLEDIYEPAVEIPLANGVDMETWLKSHWQQPDLFIRIVQNETLVIDLLQKNNIPYQVVPVHDSYTCLRLPNTAAIDKVLQVEDYIIQDKSSQEALLKGLSHTNSNAKSTFWDVCAGAGGKALLLQALYNNKAKITATDIRKSILFNLKNRCNTYQIPNIRPLVLDATQAQNIQQQLKQQKFDIILCDVPCSGSGTWSRTPEQFYFFDEAFFEQFAHLQAPIVVNSSEYLNEGGYLIYITCSVFKHENEAVVEKILAQTSLQLIHQQMILGMQDKADSLFVAVFRK